ncbi:MAG TPA: LCP family protein [Candidatus Saccharimonadia bacterium]|nr:LCP family protein [Candidatus Saccharimonadia bacterium]
MEPKKYDSFSPKRAPNIDGFFVKPAENRSRQPVFRSSTAKQQLSPAKLADMPKRSDRQTVLATAKPQVTPPITSRELGSEQPERRRRRGDQPTSEKEPKERKSRSAKRILKRAAMILGILVLLGGGWFGLKFYKDFAKLTGNANPLSLLKAFHPVPLHNQDGRVNILLAANSADDVGHNGANLTDSIMVLSVNTKNNTALILSVPRDLWVSIPGAGHAKINSAFPDGGMNALQTVIQDNLDLTIDYTALVDYGAFRDLVDAVGGIHIAIASDDPRGIYDPSLDYTSRHCCALAKYPNGPVTLNGKQALNLARARGDAYGSYGYAQSDFTRTMYQRKMLLAVKDKAVLPSVIANPFKVSSLLDAVGNNIKTSLQLNEIETLFSYMKKIDDSKIDSYNINTLMGKNTTMLANYTSPDGQSALVPAAGIDNFTDIQKQIQKLFTADPVTKEGAVTVVLNGTQTPGLASAQANKLIAKGMNVSVADAPANQPATTLIDNSGGNMPNTLAYLKTTYHATIVVNKTLSAGYPSADFILILGQSAAPATASSPSVSR